MLNKFKDRMEHLHLLMMLTYSEGYSKPANPDLQIASAEIDEIPIEE